MSLTRHIYSSFPHSFLPNNTTCSYKCQNTSNAVDSIDLTMRERFHETVDANRNWYFWKKEEKNIDRREYARSARFYQFAQLRCETFLSQTYKYYSQRVLSLRTKVTFHLWYAQLKYSKHRGRFLVQTAEHDKFISASLNAITIPIRGLTRDGLFLDSRDATRERAREIHQSTRGAPHSASSRSGFAES